LTEIHHKTASFDDERIWKLLKYNTRDALTKPNLTKKEKAKLIYRGEKDVSQSDEKRVFMQSYLEDSFVIQCSLIKIYIDSVVPQTHLISTVNVCIDIMSHSKTQVVYNDASDEIEYPDEYRPIEGEIMYKNRNTLLLKCLLSVLNGRDIAGVGMLQFNQQLSPFSQSRSGIFDNRQFNGSKNIFCFQTSGVSPV